MQTYGQGSLTTLKQLEERQKCMTDMYANFVHVTFIESGFGFKARIDCGIELHIRNIKGQMMNCGHESKKVRSPINRVPCNITGIIMAFEFDRNELCVSVLHTKAIALYSFRDPM